MWAAAGRVALAGAAMRLTVLSKTDRPAETRVAFRSAVSAVPVVKTPAAPPSRWLLATRATTLAWRLGPFAASLPLVYWIMRWWPECRFARWWLSRLTSTLANSGAVWIKVGQWASTRTDLFPPLATTALARLQHAVPPCDAGAVNVAVCAALGIDKLSCVFAHFDSEKPLGSGAVAQVHAATLRDGREVAVKVIRPGVELEVEADLQLFQAVAPVALLALGFRGPARKGAMAALGDFAAAMRRQLDLRVEAASLEKFSAQFSGPEWAQVTFPRVQRAPSRTVLVETREAGVALSQFVQNETARGSRTCFDQVAALGIRTYLQMLLRNNFCHADLHGGNVLVRFAARSRWTRPQLLSTVDELGNTPSERLERDYEPQLVVLDCGLVAELSSDQLNVMRGVVAAALQGSGRRVAQYLVSGSLQPDAVADPARLGDELEELFIKFNGATAPGLRLSDVSSGGALVSFANLLREHAVQVPGPFALVLVSALMSEGLARSLDPNMDVWCEVADIVFS